MPLWLTCAHMHVLQAEIGLRADIIQDAKTEKPVEVKQWYAITKLGEPVGKSKISLKISWHPARQQLVKFLHACASSGALCVYVLPMPCMTRLHTYADGVSDGGQESASDGWSADEERSLRNYYGTESTNTFRFILPPAPVFGPQFLVASIVNAFGTISVPMFFRADPRLALSECGFVCRLGCRNIYFILFYTWALSLLCVAACRR